jgi:hypothetical protein
MCSEEERRWPTTLSLGLKTHGPAGKWCRRTAQFPTMPPFVGAASLAPHHSASKAVPYSTQGVPDNEHVAQRSHTPHADVNLRPTLVSLQRTASLLLQVCSGNLIPQHPKVGPSDANSHLMLRVE